MSDEPRTKHQPGDFHQFRINCEVCGESGTIRLSIDPGERLTAEDIERLGTTVASDNAGVPEAVTS